MSITHPLKRKCIIQHGPCSMIPPDLWGKTCYDVMIPRCWLSTKSESFALASSANRQGWTSGQCPNSKQKFLYRRTVFFLWGPSSVSARCAVFTVRWPCGILAIAVRTLSHRKTIFLRLFFLCSFRKKTLKLLFRFSALETLFLEHSKSVKMTQKSQI